MKAKPVRNPEKAAKKARPKSRKDNVLDVLKDVPGARREGRNNLRQRAQWFRRHTGDSEVK
jgi:hypothetical protein